MSLTDAEALADVRTLDDWFRAHPLHRALTVEEGPTVVLFDGTSDDRHYHRFLGDPEVARAKAAAWVRAQDAAK